ncbi:allene oxide cyclase barrel-like domain-containing protein [Streptomyces sp. 900105245]
MMVRRMRAVGLIGVAAATVLLAPAESSLAAGVETGRDGKTAKVIKVTNRLTRVRVLELGGPQPSVGNETIGSGDILNARGKVIGSFAVECTVTQHEPPVTMLQCLSVLDLPEGQIMFHSRQKAGENPTAAVTGGTGAYVGAGGTATFVDLGNREQAVTITLTAKR